MSNRSVSQYCMTCSLSSIWCMNPPLKCSYAVTVETVLFIRLFSFWHRGTKTTANKYAMRSYWDTVIVVATSVVSFCFDKLFEKKELFLHASITMPSFHHNLYCCRTFLHFPYIESESQIAFTCLSSKNNGKMSIHGHRSSHFLCLASLKKTTPSADKTRHVTPSYAHNNKKPLSVVQHCQMDC